MKYTFPATYGQDCILVEIDAALVPLAFGALRIFERSYTWQTEADYELGYNAFAQLQAELMGKCLEKLQMEIRALRGVDDLQPGYNDPDADPFTLSLGTVEDNRRAIQATNSKLEEIRLILETMQGATELEDILAGVSQIALLLA